MIPTKTNMPGIDQTAIEQTRYCLDQAKFWLDAAKFWAQEDTSQEDQFFIDLSDAEHYVEECRLGYEDSTDMSDSRIEFVVIVNEFYSVRVVRADAPKCDRTMKESDIFAWKVRASDELSAAFQAGQKFE